MSEGVFDISQNGSGWTTIPSFDSIKDLELPAMKVAVRIKDNADRSVFGEIDCEV